MRVICQFNLLRVNNKLTTEKVILIINIVIVTSAKLIPASTVFMSVL